MLFKIGLILLYLYVYAHNKRGYIPYIRDMTRLYYGNNSFDSTIYID